MAESSELFDRLVADDQKLWRQCLAALTFTKINKRNIETWLKPLEPVGSVGKLIILGAATGFNREYVDRKYASSLAKAIGSVLGVDVDVRIVIKKTEGDQAACAIGEGGEVDPFRLSPPPEWVDPLGLDDPLADVDAQSFTPGPRMAAPIATAPVAADITEATMSPAEYQARIEATAAKIRDKEAYQALTEADRFKRKNGKRPKFFTYPRALMFPWRVIKPGNRKDEAGNDIIGPDGKPVKIHLKNFWIGRNGQYVHVVEGGLDEDGDPLGIPGHSFPLLVGIYLVTECKSPMDKGTQGRMICLGDTLADFARYIGYLTSFRGVKRSERFLERLNQYLNCTHRIIMYATEQQAFDAYLEMIASGHVPGPEEMGESDASFKVAKPQPAPFRQFNVWTKADVGRRWNERGPFGFVELSQEFYDRFVKPHSIPLDPLVVSRLVGQPQALSVYVTLAQTVDRLWKKPPGKRKATIKATSVQDEAGLDRSKKNKRPAALKSMINNYIRPAWDDAAEARQKPESKLKLAFNDYVHQGRTAATIDIEGTPSLINKKEDVD